MCPDGLPTAITCGSMPSDGWMRLAHLEGAVQLMMVAIEQVEHHGLQGIRRQQAMVGPKQPTFVVAPSLHLPGCTARLGPEWLVDCWGRSLMSIP